MRAAPAHHELKDRVGQAYARREPLAIRGAGTKAFYGRSAVGELLDVGGYCGVVAYEPTELVVTVRAGTSISELAAVLLASGQMLPFEPPEFGKGATVGGAVACGLAGPRRPYVGGVRDYVLGVTCINGKGQVLRFGGQVMKNVAGFDVSRLLAGSLGTLAVLLDISLKVLPRPASEITLTRVCGPDEAIQLMNKWAGLPLPLTGTCHHEGQLYVRLSGAESAVTAAAASVGGEKLPGAESFWRDLRDHALPFFARSTPLWRVVVPPARPPLPLAGDWLLDWGGAQRWLFSPASRAEIERTALASGGYAHLFRGGDREAEVFAPLGAGLAEIHKRVKEAFDPARVLNPGRMYSYL